MKSFIIALVVILSVNLIAAQDLNYDVWETVEITDEFGDPTGDTAERYFTRGTFSNSVTTASDLIVKVVKYPNDGLISITMYEYGRSTARLSLSGEYGDILVKREDGSKETYQCFASKNGGLSFMKNRFKKFDELLTNGGETIQVLIKSANFSTYGNSSYRFELKTQG